ncbi:MAG: methylated-DNA--[protein]-cysteine S-methyltransferase [Bacteroidales bacterium]|nr:methylated-DNA--[protein]-cysteine S-methyltransferase [Bacteroidales bacterium]
MSEKFYYKAPWGRLIITIEDEALSGIEFLSAETEGYQKYHQHCPEEQVLQTKGKSSLQTKSENRTYASRALHTKLNILEKQGESQTAQMVCKQLDEYFAGERQVFDLPLRLPGTSFQKVVWEALQQIPYGTVLSYSQVAQAIGRPKAQRAVGMACNRNPVPIIVPCHRVLGSGGQLTGYAGGLELKVQLLKLEKKVK